MDRDMLGLGDEASLRVADRRRVVTTGVEDLRISRAEHRLAHLLDDGLEPMIQDGHRDGIDHPLVLSS